MADTVSRNFTGVAHFGTRSIPHSTDFCGVEAIAAEEARRQPGDWLNVVGYGGLLDAAHSAGAELCGHHAEEQYGVCRNIHLFACPVFGK